MKTLLVVGVLLQMASCDLKDRIERDKFNLKDKKTNLSLNNPSNLVHSQDNQIQDFAESQPGEYETGEKLELFPQESSTETEEQPRPYPHEMHEIFGDSYYYFGGKDTKGRLNGIGFVVKNVLGDWRSIYIGGFCEGDKRGFGVEAFLNSKNTFDFIPMLTEKGQKPLPTECPECIMKSLRNLNTCKDIIPVLKYALKKFPVPACVPIDSMSGDGNAFEGFPLSDSSDSKYATTIDIGTKLTEEDFKECPASYKGKFKNSKCLVFNCKNPMNLSIKLYSMTSNYHPLITVSDMISDNQFQNVSPTSRKNGTEIFWNLSDKKRYIIEAGRDEADPLGGVSHGQFSMFFDNLPLSWVGLLKDEKHICTGNVIGDKKYHFQADISDKGGYFYISDLNGKELYKVGKFDPSSAPIIDANNQSITFFFNGLAADNGTKKRGELTLYCGNAPLPVQSGTRSEGGTLVYFLKSTSKAVCAELSKAINGNSDSVKPVPLDGNGNICISCLANSLGEAAKKSPFNSKGSAYPYGKNDGSNTTNARGFPKGAGYGISFDQDSFNSDRYNQSNLITWPVTLKSSLVFTENNKCPIPPYFKPTLEGSKVFHFHSPSPFDSIYSFMLFTANREYNPVLRLFKAQIDGHGTSSSTNYELVTHTEDSYSLFNVQANTDYIVEIGLEKNRTPVGETDDKKFTLLIGERNLDLYASYASTDISSSIDKNIYGFGIRPNAKFIRSKNAQDTSFGALSSHRTPYFDRKEKKIVLFYVDGAAGKFAELTLQCSSGISTKNGPESFIVKTSSEEKITATLISSAPCAIIQLLK